MVMLLRVHLATVMQCTCHVRGKPPSDPSTMVSVGYLGNQPLRFVCLSPPISLPSSWNDVDAQHNPHSSSNPSISTDCKRFWTKNQDDVSGTLWQQPSSAKAPMGHKHTH